MEQAGFFWNGSQYAAANGIQQSVRKQLLDSIAFREGMRVLDAGCGNGDLTFQLGERVPNGHVTGIDLSASMIQACMEGLQLRGEVPVEFRVEGIQQLTDENEFDLVFSNSMLHWVTDLPDAARRFYRALKYGGSIAVQFPLLNERHPLVAYAGRAIRELGLQARYRDWRFPWYVPACAEDFAEVLTRAGFRHVAVFPRSNRFPFHSPEEAFLHFQSVGLSLYTAPLSGEEPHTLMEQVKADLRRDFPETVTLMYERLFAYGQKARE